MMISSHLITYTKADSCFFGGGDPAVTRFRKQIHRHYDRRYTAYTYCTVQTVRLMCAI
jgi:hypothetical protein